MGIARSRAWRLALPALVAVAAALAVLAVVLGDEGPETPDPPIALADVVENPAEYADRQVVLRGTVEEVPPQPPADSAGALVLAAAGGGRVLVIPERPSRARGVEEGAAVHVSGVVSVPGTAADERSVEQPPLTRADLVAATGADAVLEAVEIAPAPSS